MNIYPGEVERIFNQDIREKKLAGYGASKRTGKGVRHGIRGGMRTPSSLMTKREKKDYMKPGELIVSNVYEFMPWEQFKQLGEIQQKDLLIRWREKFTNIEIRKRMGLDDHNTYFRLINKLGLANPKHTSGNASLPPATDEKMEDYKNNGIDYDTYKKLPHSQRYEILEKLNRDFLKAEDLAQYWGVSKDIVYQTRAVYNKWRLRQEKKVKEESKGKGKGNSVNLMDLYASENTGMTINQEEEIQQEDKLSDESMIIQQETIPQIEIETVQAAKSIQETELTKPELTAFYRLNGIYSSDKMTEKLKKVLLLIADEDNDFEIELSIREVRKSEEQEKKQLNDKIIEALSGLFK